MENEQRIQIVLEYLREEYSESEVVFGEMIESINISEICENLNCEISLAHLVQAVATLYEEFENDKMIRYNLEEAFIIDLVTDRDLTTNDIQKIKSTQFVEKA